MFIFLRHVSPLGCRGFSTFSPQSLWTSVRNTLYACVSSRSLHQFERKPLYYISSLLQKIQDKDPCRMPKHGLISSHPRGQSSRRKWHRLCPCWLTGSHERQTDDPRVDEVIVAATGPFAALALPRQGCGQGARHTSLSSQVPLSSSRPCLPP